MWLISLSWRSGLMFRCGVRRRLRCSLLWVWVLVLWSRTLPTTRGTTTAIETRSPCLESTSWRLFWPRWWCLLCWASEPKPSPQSVLNGQYAAQTQRTCECLILKCIIMHQVYLSIFYWSFTMFSCMFVYVAVTWRLRLKRCPALLSLASSSMCPMWRTWHWTSMSTGTGPRASSWVSPVTTSPPAAWRRSWNMYRTQLDVLSFLNKTWVHNLLCNYIAWCFGWLLGYCWNVLGGC